MTFIFPQQQQQQQTKILQQNTKKCFIHFTRHQQQKNNHTALQIMSFYSLKENILGAGADSSFLLDSQI